MAQFDIHRFADDLLVADLQSNVLSALATRLVAPVYPLTPARRAIRKLNPVMAIDGQPHFIAIQELSAVRSSALGVKVETAEPWRDEILAALDLLIVGF
jgi:toxin CcdB